MAHDPQLTLFDRVSTDPNVRWLEKTLWEHREWITARGLRQLSGGRLDDREIRALAAVSPDVISGQGGYRHIERSTPEEIRHAAAWLESQGRKMVDRSIAIRRRAHTLLG